MALVAVLASLAGLSATDAAHYKKADSGPHKDKYVVEVTAAEGMSLDDVEGLKNTVSATRRERDEAAAKLKLYGDVTPDAAAEAVKKAKELGTGTEAEKIKSAVDSATKQLTEKHAGEIGAKDKAIADSEKWLGELVVDAEVSRAILESGGDAGTVKLMLPHAKTFMKVVKDAGTGRPRAQVLQDDGVNERLTKKPNSTAGMAVSEFVGEVLKKDKTFASAWPGNKASGTGAGGAGGSQQNGRTGGAGPGGADRGSGGGAGGTGGDGRDAPASAVSRLSELRRSGGINAAAGGKTS